MGLSGKNGVCVGGGEGSGGIDLETKAVKRRKTSKRIPLIPGCKKTLTSADDVAGMTPELGRTR